jgi:hypothetical protein
MIKDYEQQKNCSEKNNNLCAANLFHFFSGKNSFSNICEEKIFLLYKKRKFEIPLGFLTKSVL